MHWYLPLVSDNRVLDLQYVIKELESICKPFFFLERSRKQYNEKAYEGGQLNVSLGNLQIIQINLKC